MNEDILRGKNCLLTGATGGLGRLIAVQFAKKGCDLFLTARTASGLEAVKREVELSADRDVRISYEPGDLDKPDNVDKIIASARQQMQSIEILINCAGVFPVLSLAESSLEDFDTCFNVNVRAPFRLTKAFASDMAANKWGRIVNIGSSSAYGGFRDTSIYCASKHALLGLSRALHDELKEHNVRIYCVSPGSMKTSMGRLVKNQLWDTFIDPQEVAEFTVFLVSYDKEMISQEVRLNRMVNA